MGRELLRLSHRDRELLAWHYDFYRALADGSRCPTTDAQRHFVAVCQGRTKPATEHEEAYLHLRELAHRARMSESQVAAYGFTVEVPVGDDVPPPPDAAASPSSPSVDFDLSAFEEFGEGVPRPGWFTDEGWKRMRAGYRYDSR